MAEFDTVEDIDYARNLGHRESAIAESKAQFALACNCGKRRWVNSYTTSQQFGGCEEGGWYYTEGSPVASIPVYTEEDIQLAMSYLERWRKFFEEKELNRTIVGYDVCLETHKAARFPKHRPHYE